MKLALREMRRRPGRFVTATVILTLIALLLMFLGGLLDGLIDRSTSAIEAQRGEVVVFSSTSQSSFPSSRLTGAERDAIAAVPGVGEVGGLSVSQLGARVPGNGPRDLLDVALFGYEIPPEGVPDPPAAGEAWADESLRELGVTEGVTLELGPARSPMKIAGFVSGLAYSGQGTLWTSPDSRREVQNANRPDAREGDGVFQGFVVTGTGDADAAALAARIDQATDGATASLSVTAAAAAQPGVEQQTSTFNQIIGVTVVIAIVVVALFFALLIVERTALYGVLKAMGARSSTLFGGVVLQAVVVTAIASAIGAGVSLAVASVIPAGGIPFQISTVRIVSSVGYLLVAAIIGCAFSLRRVLRIDPASAIGSAQ
jgi:putative ABC transport system permease protein